VSLHSKKGLGKKDKKTVDVMTRFWYTLKNLHPYVYKDFEIDLD
jgi:hypothetical protein